MEADRVGDMTMQEFRIMVESVVDQRIREKTRPYRQTSKRPLKEVIAEMEELLIESPPGSPSVVEMLREDRDR